MAKRADFQTRKLTLVDNFMCNIHFNHGNIVNTLSRTKIISHKHAMQSVYNKQTSSRSPAAEPIEK